MDILIHPGKLSGSTDAVPSKSQAHRLLICAAFGKKPVSLLCPHTNEDMEATADCLCALGARILRTDDGYHITPAVHIPEAATLNCRESGTTLRFLLPVAGALGVRATFVLEGRLPHRPLSPLWEEMERMGCHLSRPDEHTVFCQGKLIAGDYTIPGNISSQFVSGLLFALSLIPGESTLTITGKVESAPYIAMTKDALSRFAPGSGIPDRIAIEGDWSNGAFWLAAGKLGSSISVKNLNENSLQGDRAVLSLLDRLQNFCTICAEDIPDLVPILSVVAAANQGACFTGIRRLRLKESDRVDAIVHLLRSLGGMAVATEDTLTISGTGLSGGVVNSFHDHRIAMAAAIASTVCNQCVTILDADCVRKSAPRFWEEFRRLGGNYEQYLR